MKRLLCICLLLAVVLSVCPAIYAEETAVEIHTAEDLLRMAENPAGSWKKIEDSILL